MKKIWNMFIFKLERDSKFRMDTILLSLSAIMLITLIIILVVRPSQKQVTESLLKETHPSTVVGTNSSTPQFSSKEENGISDNPHTSQTTTETTEEESPTMTAFVGGWMAQNGTFFFINSDESVSALDLENNIINTAMENMELSYTDDGRSTLSYIENNVAKEWIKGADGSLTSEGLTFEFIGVLTIEEYLNGY